MRDADRYVKVVAWSDEDGCYVGSSPGLFFSGCYGDDERQVFDELCEIVAEQVALYVEDGQPLPPPTTSREVIERLSGAA